MPFLRDTAKICYLYFWSFFCTYTMRLYAHT